MDVAIVVIIVGLAAFFSLRRLIAKLKPDASPCGNGCSCGANGPCSSSGIQNKKE